MRLSTKLSGIVAVGGVAALGAGLISSGGIGAEFTDSATATAHTTTGTLNCQLADSQGGVSVNTGDPRAVSFDLGQIANSEAGESFGTVKVENTGSLALVASWSITDDGTAASDRVHPYWIKQTTTADQMLVAPEQKSSTMPIGFQWTSLTNDDQGKSFSVTYKVDCFDTVIPPSSITLLGHDGGHATYNGNAVLARLDDGGAAGFFVNDASSLPESAPRLKVANESADANLYWQIRVNNGTDDRYIKGDYANGSWSWTYNNVSYPDTDASWQDLISHVSADGYTPARAYAQIANGPSNIQSADFTCMKYGTSAGFGTGC